MKQITNEQEFDLAVAFVTAAGSPSQSATTPVWSVDDQAVVTLQVATDGLSAVVVSGATGLAVVTVTGTSAGGASIIGTFDVEVTAADAASVVFTDSAARQKPAP